jgi:hypothetical protein
VHLSCKQWRPFYRREREHGVSGSAAGARLVSANEGEGRSRLSAEGCGGLQALAGALVGGGVVGSEGDMLGGPGRFSSMPSMSHGLGSGQRGLRIDKGVRGDVLEYG